MARVRIDIEEVRGLCERRREINRTPLEDIDWHEGGKPLAVAPAAVEEFRFTGLSNCDFVDVELWKEAIGG